MISDYLNAKFQKAALINVLLQCVMGPRCNDGLRRYQDHLITICHQLFSHDRTHVVMIVFYRHREERLPEAFPRADLATPERTHRNADLRRLILVDFPDFDSVEADHAAILTRCLPHLDITFVVVDETKYGDQRLYQTLSSFPQDPDNLYLIFNKIDELAVRYGSSYEAVVDEILDDLRNKVEQYVGWNPRDGHVVPISALVVLQGRLEPEAEASGPPGDFLAVEKLLANYRLEKRRLAAKEVNLEHLKRTFVDDLRETFLRCRPEEMADRAEGRLQAGLADVEAVLEASPSEVLGPLERSSFRNGVIRRLRPKLGFPMDLCFTVLGEWRVRRSRKHADVPDRLADRLAGHYGATLESLQVFDRRYHSEVAAEFHPRDVPAEGERDPDTTAAPRSLDDEMEDRIGRLMRRRFRRNHLLALLGLLGFLWYLVHPVAVEVIEGLEGDFAWTSVLWQTLGSLIKALNPVLLLGGACFVVLLYGVSALWLWSRLTHAVEDSITAVEAAERERIRVHIRTVGSRFAEAVDTWRRERSALDERSRAARPGGD